MAEAGLAARRVVTDTLAVSVMSSDAAIESLVIFLRYSSLPGAHLFERRCVRCGVRSLIMMIFRAASSRAARCGAYRATGTELDWMRLEEQGLRGRSGNKLAKVRVFRLTGFAVAGASIGLVGVGIAGKDAFDLGKYNLRRQTAMKRTRMFVVALAVLGFCVIALKSGVKNAAASGAAPAAATAQQAAPAAPTIASVVDSQISGIEKEFVAAAEAMPEDNFNFSPESLKIPGSEYKGVRTFALQLKHVAISNYFIWSPITGDKVPESLQGDNGAENVKSKTEIIKLLKDSFALGHKAAATLTAENMLQIPEHSKSTRLRLATFGVAHAYDHYGQLIEYLRMNGIVPPASRGSAN